MLSSSNIDADAFAIAEAVRRTTPPGRNPLRSVTIRAPNEEDAERLRARVRAALAADGWGDVEVEVEVGTGACGLVAIEVASKA